MLDYLEVLLEANRLGCLSLRRKTIYGRSVVDIWVQSPVTSGKIVQVVEHLIRGQEVEVQIPVAFVALCLFLLHKMVPNSVTMLENCQGTS
jgi:hypothetical protein